MKLSIVAGATSQSINFFVRDSNSTTGAGLTGLVFNTAGLTAYYALPLAAPVAITLATLAAITTAWSSGGFIAVDGTNMPGWYRLDLPNAALASGRFVSLHLKGATNMAPLPIEIELTGWNNQDAAAGGLSSVSAIKTKTDFLPSVTAGAAGGLTIAGSNAATTFATLTVSGATTLTGNVSMAAGLSITQSTLNGNGLVIAANGNGAGLLVTSPSGVGVSVTGAINVGAVSISGTLGVTGALTATNASNSINLGTDAITSATLAASAVTEIQTGLATPTNITAGTITTVGTVNVLGLNAIDSNAVAPSAVTEIQTGLALEATSLAVKAKTDGMTFTVANQLDANMVAVSGSTESADRLERSTLAIVTGTVGVGSTTTSIVTSALSPAGTDADQFKGRIITFDKDTTTAALRGQATDITANTAAATPTFTCTALTAAPASGDTFVIT